MSFNFGELSFFILVIFVLAWIIQMAYHWILFRRLAFYKKHDKSCSYEPVSVIVCARDAYEYLLDIILELFLAETCEVILIRLESALERRRYLRKPVDDPLDVPLFGIL